MQATKYASEGISLIATRNAGNCFNFWNPGKTSPEVQNR